MSRPPLVLAGRTAVVTGAASGIGRALALEAAARGMAVAICDLPGTALHETAAAVEASGQPCLAEPVDVTDALALARFAAAVAARLPPVALLFANAGVLRQGSLLDMPADALRLLFEVNVLGAVKAVRAFLPGLRATGVPAQIVITASTGMMASHPHLAGYCATKHALWPIGEGLRADLAGSGVGVSLLMPGAVTTGIFAQADPDRATPPDSIGPEAAARIAFAGAKTDRFLILTHPAFVERARVRFEDALDQMAEIEA